MEIVIIIILAILLIILFLFAVSITGQLNRINKKISDLKIPYDHYAHLQKAYIEYFKWLNNGRADKLRHSKEILILCSKKFEELFDFNE